MGYVLGGINVMFHIAFWVLAGRALFRWVRRLWLRYTEPPELPQPKPPENLPEPYMSPVQKREYHGSDGG